MGPMGPISSMAAHPMAAATTEATTEALVLEGRGNYTGGLVWGQVA